jgi:RimJ/RimL family protein N-acetyltransferase
MIRKSGQLGRAGADYEVNLCAATAIKPKDLKACFAIIGKGGAVRMASMKRDLPRATVLVIARVDNEIVAIGAIKPVRKQYATGIAAKSGFAFPAETPELGYVAVHPDHRNRGLSHRVTELLLSQHSGLIFATTSSEAMKKVLEKAGFVQRGRAWDGSDSKLSLRVREEITPAAAATASPTEGKQYEQKR